MPPNAHATLGASGAHRWMACPGSVRLEAGLPDSTSLHAIEGTAAHELAEACLQLDNAHPHGCIGSVITVEGEHIVVTEEMADAVKVFVDYVRIAASETDARVEYEMRVGLDVLHPPAPMYGTADAVIWQPHSRILTIADFKYGQGVVVEAENNPQLRYYALAAVLTMKVRPDLICMTVVQPRAEHEDGPVRVATMTWADLIAFRDELLEAAHKASKPDAPVGPVGKHCRFCRAKAICPAQRSTAVAIAQSEFETLPAAGPPPPEALTTTELLAVMDKASLVEDWLTSVRNYVQSQLEQGHEMPGWKLVAKRATRRWTNETEAEKALRKHHKVGDIFTKKLISPAQAEALAKRNGTTIPADLIVSQSSGHNLARESSPKPAITPGSNAADDFIET
jgi:hypothetical protein